MKTPYFRARISSPFCHSSTSGPTEQISWRHSSPNSVANYYEAERIRLRRNSKVKEEEANGVVEKRIQIKASTLKNNRKKILRGKQTCSGRKECPNAYYKAEKCLLKTAGIDNMHSSEYEKDQEGITRFGWIFKEIYSPLNWWKKKECALFKEKNILVRNMLTSFPVDSVLALFL